jgi:glutamate-1-semialdehyde aminotransferase
MNYEEIVRRREELTRGPIYGIPDDALSAASEKLKKMTPKSEKLYKKALGLIPGGAQHMLVNKNPYPFIIKHALGSKMWDVDENEYVDYLMMAGPIILGHNYPPLIERITEVINTEGIGSG